MLGSGFALRLPHLLLLRALGLRLSLTRLLLRTLGLDLAHLLLLLCTLGFLCLLLRLYLCGAGRLCVLRLLALGVLLTQCLFALSLLALHGLLLHRWLVRHGSRRLRRCLRRVWRHNGFVVRRRPRLALSARHQRHAGPWWPYRRCGWGCVGGAGRGKAARRTALHIMRRLRV